MNNRDTILKTAEDLFHSKGFAKTSVDTILKSTNISKSNFYYHFGSKETLGITVLNSLINRYKEDFIEETLLNANFNPETRLKKFFEKIRNYHDEFNCDKGCPFGNLAIEQSNVNEEFRSRLSEFFSEWKSAIDICINEGINQKFFRNDIDPGYTADLVLSQVQGAILLTKTHKSITPLKNSCNQILNLILERRDNHE